MIDTIRYEKLIERKIRHDECVYKVVNEYIEVYYKGSVWYLGKPDDTEGHSKLHLLQTANGDYCAAKVIKFRNGVNVFFYPDPYSMEYQICTRIN